MKVLAYGVLVGLAAAAGVWAQNAPPPAREGPDSGPPAVAAAVERGAGWLASVQGADGGWGQDGGETSSARPGERLESTGNDVANTAVAALALLQAGEQYAPNVRRALDFILQRIEASPTEGLAVTDRQGTQIQRKLGPYIDTFLSSLLLGQLDGRLPAPDLNARVRQALVKTVAKIEAHQQTDGSWNHAGGWAPVLGTSMASRSLFQAKELGVAVRDQVLVRAEAYTVQAHDSAAAGARVVTDGVVAGSPRLLALTPAALPAAAGVPLYQHAQVLEQLSRTEADRQANQGRITAIQAQLSDARVVNGFGSMGGEELFSYLNISDSLKRIGGEAWTAWHANVTDRILKVQNADGTWAGHHCITGRVAMTSAAILNLTVDRAP